MTETGNEKSTGFWRTAWKRYRRSRIGMLAFFFLIALAAVAFFAPMLANDKPIVCRIEYTQPGDKTTNELYFPGIKETLRQIPVAGHLFTAVPPFSRMDFKFKKHFKPGRDWAIMPPVGFSPLETSQDRLQGYSGKHWLGTDELGRDVMARMIYGTQVSMRVGFISMGIAALIGLCLGAIAGFFGGWVDMIISRVIEIFMCFPVFFLILAVLAWFPPRIENIMIIIGLTRWVGIARLTRGEVLRLRELEYTAAARALPHHLPPPAPQRAGSRAGEYHLRDRRGDPGRVGTLLARLRGPGTQSFLGKYPPGWLRPDGDHAAHDPAGLRSDLLRGALLQSRRRHPAGRHRPSDQGTGRIGHGALEHQESQRGVSHRGRHRARRRRGLL